MAIDRQRTAQYLEALDRLLQDWKNESGAVTLKILEQDRKTCLFLCYVMESAIQTALDLTHHLIAAMGLEKPANYRASFAILGKHRIIPNKLISQLQELASFRNILVHQYPSLDLKKVLPHAQKSWETLREFAKAVGLRIQRRPRPALIRTSKQLDPMIHPVKDRSTGPSGH